MTPDSFGVPSGTQVQHAHKHTCSGTQSPGRARSAHADSPGVFVQAPRGLGGPYRYPDMCKCPLSIRGVRGFWGPGVVLTGAGCRRRVQGCAVVAEVTAAGLGGRGCRVAVGRAAGTELVPGGRLVEAQLTGCGREGGCREATWSWGQRSLRPGGQGADPQHRLVPLHCEGGAEAQKEPMTHPGLLTKSKAELRLGP